MSLSYQTSTTVVNLSNLTMFLISLWYHNLKSTFSPKWEQIWRRCDNLTTIAHNGNCAQSHLLLECLLTEVALCLAAHCHVKEGHFSVAALQSGQVGGNKRMAMEAQGGPSTMTADIHAV